MRETWYVLEDGAIADPNEVAPDQSGRLRHVDGVAVAMKGNVPHSRGVDDAEAERAKRAVKIAAERKAKEERESAIAKAAAPVVEMAAKPIVETKDQPPAEPASRTYQTREARAK